MPEENFDFDPNLHGNWMGFYPKQSNDGIDLEQFRTLSIKNGNVVVINQKGIQNNNIYIGLCGVKDYRKFWESMAHSDSLAIGESYGLKQLKKIAAIQFRVWLDSGNLNSLNKAKTYFTNSKFNILEKENEAIWFINDEVCKFHTDSAFIADRIQRTKYLNSKWIPEITR